MAKHGKEKVRDYGEKSIRFKSLRKFMREFMRESIREFGVTVKLQRSDIYQPST